MLGAGCEHPVGLIGSLGAEVVNHHADVGLIPAEDDGPLIPQPTDRIDASHEALTCGLFVASGAVDLAREPHSIQAIKGQILVQLQGIKAVVLDRVTRTDDLGLLEARQAVDHALLHVDGHGSGEPR